MVFKKVINEVRDTNHLKSTALWRQVVVERWESSACKLVELVGMTHYAAWTHVEEIGSKKNFCGQYGKVWSKKKALHSVAKLGNCLPWGRIYLFKRISTLLLGYLCYWLLDLLCTACCHIWGGRLEEGGGGRVGNWSRGQLNLMRQPHSYRMNI